MSNKGTSLNQAGMNEFQFLIDTLHNRLDKFRRARIVARLSEPSRTPDLIAAAEAEGVLSAVGEVIISQFANEIAKPTRILFAAQHEKNRRRNVVIRDLILEIGGAAANAGIRLAVLKGAAWVSEDPAGAAAWRSMVDIDLLVSPESFAAVPSVLEKIGYKPGLDLRSFTHHFHHPPYRRGESMVEIHRHLGWQHRLLPPNLVLGESSLLYDGLLLPAPWLRALHAIFHWQVQDRGASRGTVRLKEVLELSQFLHRADVDWCALWRHARAVEAASICEAAIALAADLLDAPIPEKIVIGRPAKQHVQKSLARRKSPALSWWATEIWRASTLWHCEKLTYRLELQGASHASVVVTTWIGRIVRLPIFAARLIGICAHWLVVVGPQFHLLRNEQERMDEK